MTLRDLVAYSLLPASSRRKHTALLGVLACGLDGADALDLLLAHCRRGAPEVDGTRTVLRQRADEAIARAEALGIRILGRFDPAYPPALATLTDAPVVLWVAGDCAALQGRLVAVVGSRAASPYGIEAAGRISADLARAGVIVVSGLARGCDAAAHRAAIGADGRTVAVLGCGPDVCYPTEHRPLWDAVRGAGAIASEHPPGTPPRPGHFPLRNRIISGLSRAVVVVEASARSGSLITAAYALEQGREVMAVPGTIFGARHTGSHALLRDGARLVETADDVLGELAWRAPTQPGETPSADPVLCRLLPGDDCDVDTLAQRTGWPAPAVLAHLLRLELAGVVRRAPGGRFVRVHR